LSRQRSRSTSADKGGPDGYSSDLAAIAKGFGLRGATITDVSQFRPLFEADAAQDKAAV
jgi:thiamine pyrophosphate-dependent acetolactate synthase large subunit-like protein